eukprot:TRINITY_DN5629_c0_g1_i1.p1 TRINITY_DN5629_c0_g1~~TRINITY_DN5629_c0_g1_i1.p1  ORF type:complete len:2412 (+),score=574.89 TRINITY_DN5629_c0_g1_i1:772-7236(+)
MVASGFMSSPLMASARMESDLLGTKGWLCGRCRLRNTPLSTTCGACAADAPDRVRRPRSPSVRRGRSPEPQDPEADAMTDFHLRCGAWVRSRHGPEFRVNEGESVSLLGTDAGWALVLARGRRGWLRERGLAVGRATARGLLRHRCENMLAEYTETGKQRSCFQKWMLWAEEQVISRGRMQCVEALARGTRQGMTKSCFDRWLRFAVTRVKERRKQLLLSQLGGAAREHVNKARGGETSDPESEDSGERSDRCPSPRSRRRSVAQFPSGTADWDEFRASVSKVTSRLLEMGTTERPPPAARQTPQLERTETLLGCGVLEAAETGPIPVIAADPGSLGQLRGSLELYYNQKVRIESVVEWVMSLPSLWAHTFGGDETGFKHDHMLCPDQPARHTPRAVVPEGKLPLIGDRWHRGVCCVQQSCHNVLKRLVEQGAKSCELGLWESDDASADVEFVSLLKELCVSPEQNVNGLCGICVITHHTPALHSGDTPLQIGAELCSAMRYYGLPARRDATDKDVSRRACHAINLFSPLIHCVDSFLQQLPRASVAGYWLEPGRICSKFTLGQAVGWCAFTGTSADVPSDWQCGLMEGTLCLFDCAGAARVDPFTPSPSTHQLVTQSNSVFEVASRIPDALLAACCAESEVLVLMERVEGVPLPDSAVVDLRLRAARESARVFAHFVADYQEPSVSSFEDPCAPIDALCTLFDHWLQRPLATKVAKKKGRFGGSPRHRADMSFGPKVGSGALSTPRASFLAAGPFSPSSRGSRTFRRGSGDSFDPASPGFLDMRHESLRRGSMFPGDRVLSRIPVQQRAWALLGESGSGKSAALIALAHRLSTQHPDWSYVFVSAPHVGPTLAEFGALESCVLDMLQVREPSQVEELKSRKLIVLLDSVNEFAYTPEESSGKKAREQLRVIPSMSTVSANPVRNALSADQPDTLDNKHLFHRTGLARDPDESDRWPLCRTVMTCRPRWMEDHGLNVDNLVGKSAGTALHILPLEEAQTAPFISRKAAELLVAAHAAAADAAGDKKAQAALAALPECVRRSPCLQRAQIRAADQGISPVPLQSLLVTETEITEALEHLLSDEVRGVPLHLSMFLEALPELQRAWGELERAAPGDVWRRSVPGVAEVYEAWLRVHATGHASRLMGSLATAAQGLATNAKARFQQKRKRGVLLKVRFNIPDDVGVRKNGARTGTLMVKESISRDVLKPKAAQRSLHAAKSETRLQEVARLIVDYCTSVAVRGMWVRGGDQTHITLADFKQLPAVRGFPEKFEGLQLLPLRQLRLPQKPGDTLAFKYAGLQDYLVARAGLCTSGVLDVGKLRQRGWPRRSLVHEAAVRWAHPGLTQALVDRGARTDLKDAQYGAQPIMAAAAARQGSAMWVLYELRHNRKMGTAVQDKVLEHWDAELRSRGAAAQGESRLADALAAISCAGQPGTARNTEAVLGAWMIGGAESMRSRTPLHFAAAAGDDRAVRELEGSRGSQTWHWETLCGRRAGADAVLGGSRLLEQGRSPAALRTLASHATALRAVAGDGSSPLHLACRQGHPRSAEALVQCGADPSMADDAGVYPLHYALEHYAFREPSVATCLRTLCSSRALTASDDEGLTALHKCCAEGWVQPAVVLVRAGADPAKSDSSGLLPLHHATSRPEFNQASALPAMALLAPPTALRWRGRDDATLLHHACREGKPTMACALIDCGGSSLTAAVDVEGRRPLDDAVASGQFGDEEGEHALALLAGNIFDLLSAQVDEGFAVVSKMADTRRDSIGLPGMNMVAPELYVYRCLAGGIQATADPTSTEDSRMLPLPPGGWQVAPPDDATRRILAAQAWGSEDGVVLSDGGLYSTNASRYSQPGGRYASGKLISDNRGRYRAKQGHVFLRAPMPSDTVRYGASARVRVEGFGPAVPFPVAGAACRRALRPYGCVVAMAVRAGVRCIATFEDADTASHCLNALGRGTHFFEGWGLIVTDDTGRRHRASDPDAPPDPLSPVLVRSESPAGTERELPRSMSQVSMRTEDNKSQTSGRPTRRKRKQAALQEEVKVHRCGTEGLGMLFDSADVPGVGAQLILADVEARSSAERSGLWRYVGWRLVRVNGVPVQHIDDAREASLAAACVTLRFENVQKRREENREDRKSRGKARATSRARALSTMSTTSYATSLPD